MRNIVFIFIALLMPVILLAETTLFSLKSEFTNELSSVYIDNASVYSVPQEIWYILLSPIFYVKDDTGKEYYVFQDNQEGNMCDGYDLHFFEKEAGKFEYKNTVNWCSPSYPEISFNNNSKEITIIGKFISKLTGKVTPARILYKNGEVIKNE
ncbi:hypothetical protein [Mucispirillum schaedleri]|uniref:hypothetical protein n=1 Tax=Mucispirillum schaedleri TaxID=248039 RepID=UPI001F5804E5|nr:hypothetical protein [Mucispirillum schaedleri]